MDRAPRADRRAHRGVLPLLLLTWAWGSVAAEVAIEAQAPPGRSESAEVGRAQVLGLGEVTLQARADGPSLLLWARDAHGRELGRGQTVVGARESEVYVRGPGGLERILIRWKVPSAAAKRE
jgi:hypothetical protein